MNTGRTKKESSSTYSPNVKRPGGTGIRLNRGSFGILLTLLLPPLGLLFLWRRGVFRIRGRMIVTALATVEMLFLFVLFMPRQQLLTLAPTPVSSSYVTHAPESEVLTALSNIDEILYQKQLEEVLAAGGNEEDLLSDEAQEERHRQEQEAILDTVVYCVYSNAKLYHAAPVCGSQSNRRELTVREAMAEGMGVCPDCNPPVYTG